MISSDHLGLVWLEPAPAAATFGPVGVSMALAIVGKVDSLE